MNTCFLVAFSATLVNVLLMIWMGVGNGGAGEMKRHRKRLLKAIIFVVLINLIYDY